MFPGQCGNTAFFFKSQPDQFHFEFRGIVFPGKSFFSAHEVSTCKISGCLSYRILDSGPDGTQTTLTVKATGKKQLIIAGVVTEVCVAFPALSAIEEGFDVFVVTDASGTFNEITRHSAWDRLSQAGAQLMTWFGVACELHRDWRNDIEGLATLFSNHIPDYRNLMTSYDTLTKQK